MQIPEQLKDLSFRFYLVRKNGKIPLEKKWNTVNNYTYKEIMNLNVKTNYGVVCGFGNLIVLDFDDKAYYDSIKDMLPPTFTVITAGKRLPHMYYILESKEQIKKIGINKNNGRVCDIQTCRCGVVAPGSSIGERFYESQGGTIARISYPQLRLIFGLDDIKKIKKHDPKKKYTGKVLKNNQKHEIASAVLRLCDVEVKNGNMQCPFHAMSGPGNLTILESGMIYCFHCMKSLWPDQFLAEMKKITQQKAQKIIKEIKILFNETKGDGK